MRRTECRHEWTCRPGVARCRHRERPLLADADAVVVVVVVVVVVIIPTPHRIPTGLHTRSTSPTTQPTLWSALR